jgi:hypothetical protein
MAGRILTLYSSNKVSLVAIWPTTLIVFLLLLLERPVVVVKKNLGLVHLVHCFSRLDVDTTKIGQTLATHCTTITSDFWFRSIAIGHQSFQFQITNLLWHGSHQVIVMHIQNACENSKNNKK